MYKCNQDVTEVAELKPSKPLSETTATSRASNLGRNSLSRCGQVCPPPKKFKRRRAPLSKQYLLISDFDQTLSFNDSGIVLSEMLGITGFQDKIAGLSKIHLVQQGGE